MYEAAIIKYYTICFGYTHFGAKLRSACKQRAMIVAKTLATLVHCCTSANFQSVCLLFFMFFFFALFFNVLYEPNYFFTSNRSINIRSTIFILATCYLLISIPSSEYIFFIVLSFFAFIWSNDYG